MNARATLESFRVNGCANPADEPYSFIDQAHGVLECLLSALEAGDPPGDDVMASAVRAASTLTFLAKLGSATLDHAREQRGIPA